MDPTNSVAPTVPERNATLWLSLATGEPKSDPYRIYWSPIAKPPPCHELAPDRVAMVPAEP